MNNTRREFLRKVAMGGAATSILPVGSHGAPLNQSERITMDEPLPDKAQKAWMDLKFGMFIHFGINTFYDTEWSNGDLDVSVFNPADLDTDRWCEVAARAGMNYIVLVCKHHDGFCLWHTGHTSYSVKNTPFKKDIVDMLSKSAQKFGLKLGMYYSLWDANNPLHNTDENGYVEFMKNQLSELLTQYGEVVELWFDGFWKKQQSGWQDQKGEHASPEAFIQAWRMEGAFRWQIDHLYNYVKKLQPNCMIMNNPTSRYKGLPLHPVDALCGEKALEEKPYRKVWPWLGKECYFPMQIEATMSIKGNKRFPSGNWFWKTWDHSVASPDQVREWLSLASRMDANLLLNCGPSDRGTLRPEDVETLLSLKSV